MSTDLKLFSLNVWLISVLDKEFMEILAPSFSVHLCSEYKIIFYLTLHSQVPTANNIGLATPLSHTTIGL